MAAKTIDEVISQLDTIIDTARREKSRLGFFPALYRKVTVKVKEGIAQNRFEDGARMETLDVLFANRYIHAWQQYRNGTKPSKSWAYSFDMASRGKALVLQHLLLGMNAHINLDLGVAAAQTSPAEKYPALQRDFEEINRVLASLMDEVQQEIAQISPLFGTLDQMAARTDEAVCNFSMNKARAAAWRAGERLSVVSGGARAQEIDRLDTMVAALAIAVCNPALALHPGYQMIYQAESQDVRKIIDVLYGSHSHERSTTANSRSK